MSFNKNNRSASRFPAPGQFVRPSEVSAGPQAQCGGAVGVPRAPQPVQHTKPIASPAPAPVQPPPPDPTPVAEPPLPPPDTAPQLDFEMKVEEVVDEDMPSRPPWMKARLTGVKKISNKERRRRQNENLRRLLSPKSALMVLNEIMPGVQVTHQFKVEAVGASGQQYFNANNANNFCADLTLQGTSYRGYGENKLTARTAAAEQAVRDLILKKMSRVLLADVAGDKEEGDAEEGDSEETETLPMIQLASFALHKLFAEWEYEGHRVPQLKTSNSSVAEALEAVPAPPKSKPPKVLPECAAEMHPCMLLTHMRPHLEYRELAAHGDRPQSMVFTIGVEIDGTTYVGKASNKKEARKAAAKAACIELFGVRYDQGPH